MQFENDILSPEQKQEARQYEIFSEVAEHNMEMLVNSFKSKVWEYRALNTHKITKVLTEEEVRQLAINFFSKEVSKAAYENAEFYFDKKFTVK